MDFSELADNLFHFIAYFPANQLFSQDIGSVDIILANRIKIAVGIDTENFVVSLDNFAIIHAINQHSKPNEIQRGQRLLNTQDFYLLHKIIFEADEIINGGKRKGKECIKFVKTIENNYAEIYTAVLEVRVITSSKKSLYKKNRLALQTFYVK
jgi:HD superfamily phosphohydrolase YqeK